jgi:hypothetical protein
MTTEGGLLVIVCDHLIDTCHGIVLPGNPFTEIAGLR